MEDNVLDVLIEKVVFGGKGLARVDKKVIFVEGTLPGEKVRIKLSKTKKNYNEGELIEVLEPSPNRVNPPCSYVDECGGCQYQHIDYKTESLIKTDQVKETFSHKLNIDPDLIQPIRTSPSDYHYRQSVTLHQHSKDFTRPERLSFVGKDNSTPIVIDKCLLVDDRLQSVFKKEWAVDKDKKRFTFKVSENGEVVDNQNALHYKVNVGGVTFLTSSDGFFQNNLSVTEQISTEVKKWLDKIKPKHFFDLYSGVGTFSLLSAKDIREVICIESSKVSVECLNLNLRKHRGSGFKIVRGNVEERFSQNYSSQIQKNAVVFLDPPRQGVDQKLAELLSRLNKLNAIMYLSCDLSTLVRDLEIILSQGNFEIKEVIPFDMFPNTKHIEVLTLLEKK